MNKLNDAPILEQTEGQREKLLLIALWKLNGSKPVTIAAADIMACSAANEGMPTLFMHGHADSIELACISASSAAKIAAHHNSITPKTQQ